MKAELAQVSAGPFFKSTLAEIYFTIYTQSKAIKFSLDRLRCRDETSQRGPSDQLAEHQREKLIPAGEVFDVLISIVFFDDSKKDKLVEDLDKLGKNVRTYIHGGSISSAKLSSNRCALKILATF